MKEETKPEFKIIHEDCGGELEFDKSFSLAGWTCKKCGKKVYLEYVKL